MSSGAKIIKNKYKIYGGRWEVRECLTNLITAIVRHRIDVLLLRSEQ